MSPSHASGTEQMLRCLPRLHSLCSLPLQPIYTRYSEGLPAFVVTPETLALRELLGARRDGFLALLAKYGAKNPKLFGSVARGTATEASDIDILVHMDAADGNTLMRASGLMEETRQLYGRDDIDIFPRQLLEGPVSVVALQEAVEL